MRKYIELHMPLRRAKRRMLNNIFGVDCFTLEHVNWSHVPLGIMCPVFRSYKREPD